MREHVVAQIRHDPLAERGDEIEAQRTRKREQGRDRDHDAEIAVDQVALAGKAEIDHAADRDRHHERGQGRDDQGGEREQHPHAVTRDIRQQQKQRPQPDLAAGLPAGGDRFQSRLFVISNRTHNAVSSSLSRAWKPPDNGPQRGDRQMAAAACLTRAAGL